MGYYEDEQEKQNRFNSKPIISLLIGLTFFTVIFLTVMMTVSKDAKKTEGKPVNNKPNATDNAAAFSDYDSEMLAVVKGVNNKEKLFSLLNTETGDTMELFYTGGSNITNRYGQVITAEQVPVGSMVSVGYLKDDSKVIALNISPDTWQYSGVTNFSVNLSDSIMNIASKKYKLSDSTLVVDGESFAKLSDVAEQDELTVRGYGDTIWSIVVLKGHGTVRLKDYENFLGGSVTVGYEAMQQITDDLSITVREGNFNLTVENDEFTGTKNVTINRNKETVVSLKDLGPIMPKRGRVTFIIKPFGADLFIDGEITNYKDPIELEYGDHTIEVSLGGYVTYTGNLSLNEAGKIIRIDLPEVSSKEDVQVEETEDNTDTSDNTDSQDSDSNYDDWGIDNIVNNDGKTDQDTPSGEEGTASDKEDTDKNEDYTVDNDHYIYIQNPKGASVYFDGEFLGISPGKFKKIIGTHVITFIKEGYETQSYTIEVADDGKGSFFSLPDLKK